MSRGFDSFDIDDSRGFDSGSERGVGGGSNSSWDKWRELQNIYREEARTDNLARDGQQRFGRERPAVPREERVREVVHQRIRTNYTDRNKSYSLRDSEIHSLAEVGKFRVVAKKDLAEFAYNGDRDRMENDIENLVRQGLAKVSTIPKIEYNPTRTTIISRPQKQRGSTSFEDSRCPRISFSRQPNTAEQSLSRTVSRSAFLILLPNSCPWSPSLTSIRNTKAWRRLSPTLPASRAGATPLWFGRLKAVKSGVAPAHPSVLAACICHLRPLRICRSLKTLSWCCG
jgi:hypothetical protein